MSSSSSYAVLPVSDSAADAPKGILAACSSPRLGSGEMCPLCFDSNDAADDTRRNTTAVPQHPVAKAEPAWASKGDSIPLVPWRLSSGVFES
jgi:hypothetical protein